MGLTQLLLLTALFDAVNTVNLGAYGKLRLNLALLLWLPALQHVPTKILEAFVYNVDVVLAPLEPCFLKLLCKITNKQ